MAPGTPTTNFRIRGTGGEYFALTRNIPPGLSSYYVPGSNVVSAEDSFGCFLLQQIQADGFTCRYSVYDIKEDISFNLSAPVSCAVCKIVLEGPVGFKFNATGEMILRNGEFNCINCTGINEQILFSKKKQYTFLELFYPTEYVLYALKYYPTLQHFSSEVKLAQTALLSANNMVADADMMNMAHKLVHSPFSENVKKFHADLLQKLLFKVLKLAARTQTNTIKFSLQQVESIERAKQFIDMHLPNHFSISQIAKRAGLNEQILKTGFKEIFGMGLYSYLRQQIFIIAKKQLEETKKSVKEIAFEAGYKNANNFSAAFKKKFGKAPLQWREKFR